MAELRIGGRCERHLSVKPCAQCAQQATRPDMTPAQVRRLLDEMADKAGNQKRLAAQLDVSESYLSDVMTGRREPGEKLLEALGLERVVTYRTAGVGAAAPGRFAAAVPSERTTIRIGGAVRVCSVNDAACAEVPASRRCPGCPDGVNPSAGGEQQ